MRATLDWSHGLLAEPEQRLLRRLAAFSGGFTLEAAEPVAVAAGDLDPCDVVPLLESLVEHSLVVVTDDGAGGRRYRMLEPVRQYARALLDASSDAGPTGLAHALHFLQAAERAAPEYERADQVAWLDRTDADHENFSAALEWCLAHGQPETAARLGWSLWLYWWLRGHLRHGRRCMETALEQELTPQTRARAAAACAAMAFAQGDLPVDGDIWRKGYEVALTTGDPVALIGTGAGIGLVQMAGGDLAGAAASFRRAIADGEGVGPETEWCVALAHLWLGHHVPGRRRPRRGGGALQPRSGVRGPPGRPAGHLHRAVQPVAGRARLVGPAGGPPPPREGHPAVAGDPRRGNLAYFPDALAVVESGEGQPERVAVLLGATQSLRETVGSNVYGYYLPDDALRLRAAEQARAALGEDTYDDVLDTGRALSPDEAVTYGVTPSAQSVAVTT